MNYGFCCNGCRASFTSDNKSEVKEFKQKHRKEGCELTHIGGMGKKFDAVAYLNFNHFARPDLALYLFTKRNQEKGIIEEMIDKEIAQHYAEHQHTEGNTESHVNEEN